MRINKRKIGTREEETAAAYLQKQGLLLVEKNFRCKFGEVDLIMRDGATYVFVEVKYRATEKEGHPSEAVDYRKQKTICKVSDFFRMKNNIWEDNPCRYDVVSILGGSLQWYKNAFEYIG